MDTASAKPLRILSIEDSEDDAYLFRRCLQRVEIATHLSVVPSPQEARAYLEGRPPYANRTEHPFPNLVLTDIKMPHSSGLEFLDWVKDHPKCAALPVIVFTSSLAESDIAKAYAMGATAFLVKPTSLGELQAMVGALIRFWSCCSLPDQPTGLICE